MAITPTAAQLSILELNVAMFGQAVGTTAMAAALPTFKDGNTYAQSLVTTSDAYKILSSEQAFTKVINNLSAGTGVTAAQVDALAKGLVPFVTAGLSVGAVINLLTVFLYQNAGKLTGDAAIWNNSGTQLVNKTTAASYYTLDQNNAAASADAIANITWQTGTNATAVTFQLTTAAETFIGGAGNDTFYAVVGNNVGTQDQSTLNSGDSMAGGLSDDIMYVNMLGDYNGGAMIHGIETLRLGTNTAAARAFDYNVNEGQPQVAEVTKIVYDQINTDATGVTRESLTVNNILPTKVGDVTSIPTMSWQNEAGSRAGIIGANYRVTTISGSADNQNLELQNINSMNAGDGIVNIGGGIEQITITSQGTVANNTLNNSANADTGNNAVAADIISAGTLTKVVMLGAVANGKVGGVVTDTTGGRAASQGLTDRAVGADTGVTADATTNATESNLLSVGSRVTEVDASGMTAAANVRFVAKNDGTATNVTFKGGSAGDYVEFELGNVSAAGNAGDDTFAFINAGSNSTFGESDVINGGAGSDTIQIGLNGNAAPATYNISETELRNKTSIGTLDLRGQTTNLTLSSDFLANADTANSITVRTDKIIQGSATDPANPVNWVNNGNENAATATVNLTKLSSNQAVTYLGGSGSDRLILNDATFNVLQNLDGGVYNDTAVRAAGSNRYDTITVRTDGEHVVIDANDLSNVRNMEGFVLTKNAAAADYTIVLTTTFMNNNTQASNNANTAIDDTVFEIGTIAAANNSALAAGDVVTIDVRNLLNAADTARATGFTTRVLDISSLEDAGVTVRFLGNAGTYTPAAFRALGNGTVANNGAFATNVQDVVQNSAADPGAVALFFQGTAADEAVTLIANTNSVDMAGGSDTITVPAGVAAPTGTLNGGAGTDTISLGAGVNISGATVQNVESLTLAGASTMSSDQYTAVTSAGLSVTAAGGADSVTLTTTGNIVGNAAIETYNLSAASNGITLAGATAQTINGNAAAVNDTVTTTAANLANKVINLSGGTGDTLTITTALPAFDLTTAGAAGATVTNTEIFNLQAGATGAVTMINGAGVVANITTVTGQAGGGVTLGTGGQTANVTGGNSGVMSVTANTGADSLVITNHTAADGAITYTAAPANALITNLDKITGFVAAIDRIDTTTAAGANAFTFQNIATAEVSELAGAAANAVTAAQALAAANWDAAGDTIIMNIAAGGAAGVYILHNEGVNNATFAAAEDLVIQMVGTVGVLTAANII